MSEHHNEEDPALRASLKEMSQVLLPYKRRWIISLVLSFIGMGLYVQVPLSIQRMVQGATAQNMQILLEGFWWLLVVLSLDAIGLYFRYRYGYFYFSTYIIRDLRTKVVNTVLKHSYRFIDKFRSGDLLATATSDVYMTADFFAFQFQNIFTFSAQLVTITIILYLISPTLLYVLFLFFPAMMLVVIYYRNKIHPITFHQRNIFGRLTAQVQQSLSGIQTVQSFSNQDIEVSKFDKINKDYSDSSWQVAKLSSLTQPMIEFIWSIARLILIGIGGYIIIGYFNTSSPGIGQWFASINITVDQLVAFIPALDMFLWPITFLSWMGGEYGRIQAGYGRLKRIFDEPIDIKEKDQPIELPKLRGKIKFDHVSFEYTAGKRVIDDISMTILEGSTVAFLGSTGSGKSTLIHLLTRAYDIQQGQILLDDQYDIRDVSLDSFLSQVGIVAQQPFLFQQSFLDNLTHGITHFDKAEVIEACKIADIYPFIDEKDKKLETIIGERGVNLSGGQKQRLTIARAILRKPRILILDAATSSVDVDTEYAILTNLKKLFGQCTIIIITQRLSTVKNADRIFVFDQGKIIEQGTHSELIQEKGMYAQLYQTLTGEKQNGQ